MGEHEKATAMCDLESSEDLLSGTLYWIRRGRGERQQGVRSLFWQAREHHKLLDRNSREILEISLARLVSCNREGKSSWHAAGPILFAE